MIISNPVLYMANLYAVAKTTGEISEQEEFHILRIHKELSLRKSDLTQARKLAERMDYTIQPCGGLSDSLMNLEHMMRIAYCDMQVPAEEMQILTEMCASIGITQEQIDRIYQETLQYLADHPYENTDDVIGAFSEQDIPLDGVTVLFAKSTSSSFYEALAIAKKSQSIQRQKNGKTWHIVNYPDVKAAEPISRKLASLKYVAYYYQGQEIDYKQLFVYQACREQKETTEESTHHCWLIPGYTGSSLSFIPCKQCHIDADRSLGYYGAWQKSASAHAGHVWVMDKEKLKSHVQHTYHESQTCPYLDIKKIGSLIDLLPDAIDPAENKQWEYEESYDQNLTPDSPDVIDEEVIKIQAISLDDQGQVVVHHKWIERVKPTPEFFQNLYVLAFEQGIITQQELSFIQEKSERLPYAVDDETCQQLITIVNNRKK